MKKNSTCLLILSVLTGLIVTAPSARADTVIASVQRFNCGGFEGSANFKEIPGGDGLGPGKKFVHARLPSTFPGERVAGYICKATENLDPVVGTNGFELFRLSFSDGESGPNIGRDNAKVRFFFRFNDGQTLIVDKTFKQLHMTTTHPFAAISATPDDFKNDTPRDIRTANLVKFTAYLDKDRSDIFLGDFTIRSKRDGFYMLGILDVRKADCPQPENSI